MAGKIINMTGKKFNKLTVIKRVYPNEKHGLARWLCKCDCGKEKIIRGTELRNGHIKSCGCLKKGNTNGRKLALGISSMRAIISHYKKEAEKSKREWNLTENQFKQLTQSNCYYCGSKPNNKFTAWKCNGSYIYNGIDRVDSDKGYSITNVVSCCKTCNYAKNNLTILEFKNWVKKIYNKMFLNSQSEIGG